jgi:hypothetical protein
MNYCAEVFYQELISYFLYFCSKFSKIWLRPRSLTFMLIYLASSCYDLESAIGRSMVITVQIKLLEGE